jgi:hypothetical protein
VTSLFNDPKFCNNNIPNHPTGSAPIARVETAEEKRARIVAMYKANSDPAFTAKEDLSYMLPGRIRSRGNLRGR